MEKWKNGSLEKWNSREWKFVNGIWKSKNGEQLCNDHVFSHMPVLGELSVFLRWQAVALSTSMGEGGAERQSRLSSTSQRSLWGGEYSGGLRMKLP